MASMTLSTALRFKASCLLGEGVMWHQASDAFPSDGFFFVDIHGQDIHFLDQGWSDHQQWKLPERVGWLIESHDRTTWLVGLQSGVARVRLSTSLEFIEWLVRPFEGHLSLRLNDAKADTAGRIWAGTLNNDDEARDDGVLLRIESDGRFSTVDANYKVTNGPAISTDGQLMLHSDSARRTIFAFDLHPASGRLTNKRIWKILPDDEGYPDGMTFDASDNLWLAHWGAGLISCFSKCGLLLSRTKLPTSNVTSLAFGGTDLKTLVATTAQVGLSKRQLMQQPSAGSVFEIIGHNTRGVRAMPAAL